MASSSRLFCRRQGPGGDYCVTVKAEKLLLTLPNDNDPNQLWYKEVSNKNGFMLVHKATGKVVRNNGLGVQLYLVEKPNRVDSSVLWTESAEFGNGFKVFRAVSDNGLGMDAKFGHIFEGTLVSIYYQSTSDPTTIAENGQWKLVPVAYNRLYCRRQGPGGDYCVTVRAEKLLLTLPSDNDHNQLWYKEMITKNGFMLVHKATGKAVRNSGVGVQLYLVEKLSCVDSAVLWTESGNFGCGFKTFRPVSDSGLGMDAWNGRIFEGTLVSLYYSSTSDPTTIGENGQWKLVPAPAPTPIPAPTPTPPPAPAPAPTPVYNQPSNMIYCLAGDGKYTVAVRDRKMVLTNPNAKDLAQQWYKDDTQNASPGSFMLVNRATSQVAKRSSAGKPLQLVNRPANVDKAVLWTESEEAGFGYRFIMTANGSGEAMDARNGNDKGGRDGIYVSYSKSLMKADTQKWKLVPYGELK